MASEQQQLEAALVALTNPDNARIQEAETMLRAFLKTADCLPAMIEQLEQSSDARARQMAAVLLRSRIARYWRALTPDVRTQLKARLLARVMAEPTKLVRNSVAALVSSIARADVRHGEWTELLQFLLDGSGRPEDQLRQLVMLLFRALTESMASTLKNKHTATVHQLLVNGLNDADETVRVDALKALTEIIEVLEGEQEAAAFRDLVPLCVAVLQRSVTDQSEDALLAAFAVFDAIAMADAPILSGAGAGSAPTSPVGSPTHGAAGINTVLPALVEMMMKITCNATLHIRYRGKAAQFVVDLIGHRPKQIVRHNLVPALTDCCLPLMAEEFTPPADTGDDEDDGISLTPSSLSAEILDQCLKCTPAQPIYETCMTHVAAIYASPQISQRKAAMHILYTLTETCKYFMEDRCGDLVRLVCATTKDPDASVQRAAFQALSEFSSGLQPTITEHHEVVLPALFSVFDSQTVDTNLKQAACIALDSFCEHLEDHIIPYLDPLMQKLLLLVQTGDIRMQQSAVTAIKATALAAQQAFVPYCETVCTMSRELLKQTSDELLILRCAATHCIGSVAEAVGREHFSDAMVTEFTQLVIAGFTLEFNMLREAGFMFFGCMASLLKDSPTDFDTLLSLAIPLICASLQQEDSISFADAEGAFNDELSDPDDDGDDDDLADRRLRNYSIRTSMLDEKTQALAALCVITEHAGESFLPYLEKLMDLVQDDITFPHHYIRHSAISFFVEVVKLAGRLFPNTDAPVPVKGANGVLSQNAAVFIESLMPMFFHVMEEDPDKDTVARAVEGVIAVGTAFGMTALAPHTEELCSRLVAILTCKCACQRTADDDDEDEDGDGAEDLLNMNHDDVLIESASECMEMLAAACGAVFVPAFTNMLPYLLKFTTPTRTDADRTMSVGCIAEVCASFETACEPLMPTLLPVVLPLTRSDNVLTRRNAVYCFGVFVQHATAAVIGACHPCEVLLPHVQMEVNDIRDAALRDNAVASLCKTIMAAPQVVDVATLLPMVMQTLPLTGDVSEGKNVYGCITLLYKIVPAVVVASLPDIVRVWASEMGNEEIDVDTRALMVTFAKTLVTQHGSDVTGVLHALPAEMAQSFTQYASQ